MCGSGFSSSSRICRLSGFSTRSRIAFSRSLTDNLKAVLYLPVLFSNFKSSHSQSAISSFAFSIGRVRISADLEGKGFVTHCEALLARFFAAFVSACLCLSIFFSSSS